jgi:predicted dehydrogenase
MQPVKVGVIGAGDISGVYLNAIAGSPMLELAGVASRTPERAAAVAAPFGAAGMSVEALLADPQVELVVDLTPGRDHAALNARIIAAGKSVYSEKPFALTLEDAQQLAGQAATNGVLIGSAPDTFYGAAHQAARRALDVGAIGKPVFGQSFMGLPGLELFHPNPAQFYLPGGEPPYDIGPYYIAMWVSLLGPVRHVHAAAGTGPAERTVRHGPQKGSRFPVEVPTTFLITLTFDAAHVALAISLDVAMPTQRPGDVYGTQGMLALADPIFFSGAPAQFAPASGRSLLDTADMPFAAPNRLDHAGQPVADYRGVGLVDMALALRTGRPHRTGADFVVHTVEIMEAITRSARTGQAIALHSSCARPAPLDAVDDALLIANTASPFDLAVEQTARLDVPHP